MEKIFVYSYLAIGLLSAIVACGMSVICSNFKEKYKIIPLSALHFVIYCLMQYAWGFILWTIRFNKFDNYPYKNPFCMLFIAYSIISFIILIVYYFKHNENKNTVIQSIAYLCGIHILAILLMLFFSPFKNWF